MSKEEKKEEKKEEMKISDRGVKMIMEHEGLRLKAYADPGAVQAAKKKGLKPEDPDYAKPVTIGYGHTGGVRLGDEITKSRAEELLKKDLEKAERAVKSKVKVPLNQNQHDSLVSFTYNCGASAFSNSTLLKEVNAKNFSRAGDEFLKWKYSKGEVMKGLERRRAAERELFLTPVSPPSYSPGSNSSSSSASKELPSSIRLSRDTSDWTPTWNESPRIATRALWEPSSSSWTPTVSVGGTARAPSISVGFRSSDACVLM